MVTLELKFHSEEQLGESLKSFLGGGRYEKGLEGRAAGMRTSRVSHWQSYPAITQAKPCWLPHRLLFVTTHSQSIRKSFWFCLQNRSPVRLPHVIQPPSFLNWIIATASTLPPFACPAPPHSHRGSPNTEASSHLSLFLTKHSVALRRPKSLL